MRRGIVPFPVGTCEVPEEMAERYRGKAEGDYSGGVKWGD